MQLFINYKKRLINYSVLVDYGTFTTKRAKMQNISGKRWRLDFMDIGTNRRCPIKKKSFNFTFGVGGRLASMKGMESSSYMGTYHKGAQFQFQFCTYCPGEHSLTIVCGNIAIYTSLLEITK